jgi:hypothetical protein
LIGLLLILDEVAHGLTVKGCTAVNADLLNVIPDISCTEVHTALVGCVLVLAHGLLEHDGELGQSDPPWLIAAALAHRTGSITGVLAPLVIFAFADRQVCLALAVLALGKDLDFDHRNLLKTKIRSMSGWRIG